MVSALTSAGRADARERAGWDSLALAISRRPLAGALAVLAVATLLRLTASVDSDVISQLWIAHQINGGATLYRDIIEVNPPLWFWMARPVDGAAALLHVRAEHLLVLAIGCIAALSLVATDRLLGSTTPLRRAGFLVYTSLIFLVMPWLELGQREQILLIGTVPYAILTAARRSDRPVPPTLAVLVGLGAGLGFALKHYFLICPVLLEIWLVAGQRRRWRPVRPETVAIGAVGIAYASAVLLWARDFLDSIVPLARLAYGLTGASRFVDLFQPGVVVSLAGLALIGSHWRSLRKTVAEDAAALLVAACAFLVAYFVQAKGWPYHAQPLLGCTSLALAVLLVGTAKPPRVIALAAPALLLMPFAIEAQAAARNTGPEPDVRLAVAGLPPGETVGFIATDWSIAYRKRLRYPSRYMGYWMLSAVARNEALGRPDPRLTALGARVVRDTVADYRCMPPRRIVFPRVAPDSGDFDVLRFFLRDPQFAALLSQYRPVQRTSLTVFERVSPLSPDRGCIRRAKN